MRIKNSTFEAIVGATLTALALSIVHALGLPVWIVSLVLLVGGVLVVEGLATTHSEHSSFRNERRLATAPAVVPVKQVNEFEQARKDARLLILDWASGRPTTKKHASDVHGIPQDRWARVVKLAVELKLGHLVMAEGGNKKLVFSATLNQALSALDGAGF